MQQVINRRVCSSAVIRLLSKTKTRCSKLTSGNTRRRAAPGQKRRLPCGSRLDPKKICQEFTGLDRVAPYQKNSRTANCMIRGSRADVTLPDDDRVFTPDALY